MPLLALASACAAAPAADNSTFVTVKQGQLRGMLDATGRRLFRGIPFGQPPVGDLRFRAPKAAAGWDGVRNATTWGKTCVQPWAGSGCRGCGWTTIEGRDNMGEDCLFLNVVAPAAPVAGKKFPVVVYLHAGEFDFGASCPARIEPSTARMC